jgi:hypothetical protein
VLFLFSELSFARDFSGVFAPEGIVNLAAEEARESWVLGEATRLTDSVSSSELLVHSEYADTNNYQTLY